MCQKFVFNFSIFAAYIYINFSNATNISYFCVFKTYKMKFPRLWRVFSRISTMFFTFYKIIYLNNFEAIGALCTWYCICAKAFGIYNYCRSTSWKVRCRGSRLLSSRLPWTNCWLSWWTLSPGQPPPDDRQFWSSTSNRNLLSSDSRFCRPAWHAAARHESNLHVAAVFLVLN